MSSTSQSLTANGARAGLGQNSSNNNTPSKRTSAHRYSSLDSNLFAAYMEGSPGQARRTLEAHIVETDRRIHDASKLGTSLLDQKKQLRERLQEIEQEQQKNGDITPELRKKLAELQKEYDAIEEDSARILHPRNEGVNGDHVGTGADGRTSPFKPHSASPKKQQRPPDSQKARDIELATEISTSLLGQVRTLQTMLTEKEDTLRKATHEIERLQSESQSNNQRFRNMDDSEQRYKEENWNLATQVQDLAAQVKDAGTREQRLQQSLASAKAEKSTAEREYEELRQSHANLSDEHKSQRRQHDVNMASLRRDFADGETERESMQKRIDELVSQNQDLARAVAYRARSQSPYKLDPESDKENDEPVDVSLFDHDTPISPVKGTPRHGGLESETLKSSLHHAHRMIQNLKNNIHREKTEKLELKRMLQDARDDLESRKAEGTGAANNANRRRKPNPEADPSRKPNGPSKLGMGGSTREEVLNDPAWEEFNDSPTRHKSKTTDLSTDTSDVFETATEADTDAFETAESHAGDTDGEATETESPKKRLDSMRKSLNRGSFHSTASDEEDALDFTPPPQPRFKLNMHRNGFGRSGTPGQQSSPASFISNNSVSQSKQNLADELGGLDNASLASSTPNQTPNRMSGTPSSVLGHSRQASVIRSSPASASIPKSNAESRMVDTGMMTEPAQPQVEKSPEAALMETPRNGGIITLPGTTDKSLTGSIDAREISQNQEQASLAPVMGGSESNHVGQPLKTLNPTKLSMSGITSLSIEPKALPAGKRTVNTDVIQQPNDALLQSTTDESTTASSTQNFLRGMLARAGAVLPTSSLKSSTSSPTASAKSAPSPAPESSKAAVPDKPTVGDVTAPVHASSQVAPSLEYATDQGIPVTPSREGKQGDIAENTPQSAAERSPLGRTNSLPSMHAKRLQHAGTPPGSTSSSPRTARRPGSAGSNVRSLSPREVPPLPADHKEVIAAATNRTSSLYNVPAPSTPLSASRSLNRPHTPSSSVANRTPVAPSSTPKNKAPSLAARSDISRRTSVSSFASELDERFNISSASGARNSSMMGTAGMNGFNPYGYGPDETGQGADPRMIQAITQTMIGEFLWKYTRKAGREEHSDQRHRRFFWIHPYTRTLYWSNKDPSGGGRTEHKAKSVAIEGVRVVTDQNLTPPGLHQKSIIIVTPGRSIKFTAPTSQRHETWFNALSYLLLRNKAGGPSGAQMDASYGSNSIDHRRSHSHIIANEDLRDFNPGSFYGHHASRSSHQSVSSFQAGPSAWRNMPVTPTLTQRPTSSTDRSSGNALAGWQNHPAYRNAPTNVGRSPSARKSMNDTPTRDRPATADTTATTATAAGNLPSSEADAEGFKKPRPVSMVTKPTEKKGLGSMKSKLRPGSFVGLSRRGRSTTRGDSEIPSIEGTSAGPTDGTPPHTNQSRDDSPTKRGMQNVRACCDGKHDVGSLHHHHGHRASKRLSRTGSVASRV